MLDGARRASDRVDEAKSRLRLAGVGRIGLRERARRRGWGFQTKEAGGGLWGGSRAWIWGAGGARGSERSGVGLSARKSRRVRRKTHFEHAGSTSVVQPFVVVG